MDPNRSKSKHKKQRLRVKFPLSRRERLKNLSPEDYTVYRCDSRDISNLQLANLEKIYQYGGSVDDLDLSRNFYPPRPLPGHWMQRQCFAGDVEMPLATNEDSWSVLHYRQGEPAAVSTLDRSRIVSDGHQLSPPSPNKVVFSDHKQMRRYDSEGQPVLDAVSFRSGKLPSEADSVFLPDDTRDVEYRPSLDVIAEKNVAGHARSLIKWGPEIASGLDMIWPMLGIFSFLMDVGSDILLAINYYTHEHYWWFILTLSFVLLPSLAMSIFSLILWIRNCKILKEEVSCIQWVWRAVSIIFLVSPIVRMLETLYFAYQSRNSKKDWYNRRQYYEKMLDENTDCMLVRLFETFLENSPQLVLQLYVVSQLGTEGGWFLVMLQILGLVTSWMAMTFSLVSFHTALRDSLPDKAKMILQGKVTMFLWRLFTIAARVTALALFASYYHFYVLVFAAAHFAVMFVWMSQQNTIYCQVRIQKDDGKTEIHHSEFLEFCFRGMAAFVHIFCFLNLLDGHSRLRCLAYYSVVYCENIALILLWYIGGSSTTKYSWYISPAMITVIGGFFIGIFFQLIYYKCYHPNNVSPLHKNLAIRWWVPCKELSLCNGISLLEREEDKSISNNELFEEQVKLNTSMNGQLPMFERQETRGITERDPNLSIDSAVRPPSCMSQMSLNSQYSSTSLAGRQRPIYAQKYTQIRAPMQPPIKEHQRDSTQSVQSDQSLKYTEV